MVSELGKQMSCRRKKELSSVRERERESVCVCVCVCDCVCVFLSIGKYQFSHELAEGI